MSWIVPGLNETSQFNYYHSHFYFSFSLVIFFFYIYVYVIWLNCDIILTISDEEKLNAKLKKLEYMSWMDFVLGMGDRESAPGF